MDQAAQDKEDLREHVVLVAEPAADVLEVKKDQKTSREQSHTSTGIYGWMGIKI
jgi:hypothetical protein